MTGRPDTNANWWGHKDISCG